LQQVQQVWEQYSHAFGATAGQYGVHAAHWAPHELQSSPFWRQHRQQFASQ
jgi:hypothetical protein